MVDGGKVDMKRGYVVDEMREGRFNGGRVDGGCGEEREI